MPREQRRLAAIVCTDVVGYSRLIGVDEAGTLARLKALRRELIDPRIAEDGGRLVKTTGDGLLVEFSSVVDAVRCSVAMQQEMAHRDPELPSDRRIRFRIGVHVGDIVIDGEDILGDGVNVAARLEGLAEPGGVCVSQRVQEDIVGKLDLALRDGGEQSLRNIARPVRVWHWSPVDSPPPGMATPASAFPLALPNKPSLAVLPFQNMSGDPEQEYFVDGLVEEIITALSRFKSLFVIARNSSFAYKGKSPDIRTVGHELGVRYVLEGSVRKAGGRLRITGQLIDSQNGAHLWADRFDGALEDVFQLQDQMTVRIVGAIAPRVDRAEIERAKRKPVDSLDAYDCLLRGISRMHEQTREAYEEALRLFHRAIALDPGFSEPYGMVARCHAYLWGQGWCDDRQRAKEEIRRVAARVAVIGHDDATALCAAGYALVRACEDDALGLAMVKQGLEINPNLAVGWTHLGAICILLGDSEKGIDCVTRAMRMNPLDPDKYWSEVMISFGRITEHKYDEAAVWAEQALVHRPNFFGALWCAAVAHALAGRVERAQTIMPRIRAMHPAMRLSNLRDFSPPRKPEHFQLVMEGMRLAGLPE